MADVTPDDVTVDSVAARKVAMRRAAGERRDGLEIDDRLEWDQAIAERAEALSLLQDARGVVAGYWPMRSEADPRPILVGLKERGLPLALPAVVRRAGAQASELEFRAWTPWEPIGPGGFGTLVPAEGAAILRPAVLLVPLLAFDRRGARLGYGKGHYDRAIASLRKAGALVTIGIAYAAQEVEAVPTAPHDMALDAILTEVETILPGDLSRGTAP